MNDDVQNDFDAESGRPSTDDDWRPLKEGKHLGTGRIVLPTQVPISWRVRSRRSGEYYALEKNDKRNVFSQRRPPADVGPRRPTSLRKIMALNCRTSSHHVCPLYHSIILSVDTKFMTASTASSALKEHNLLTVAIFQVVQVLRPQANGPTLGAIPVEDRKWKWNHNPASTIFLPNYLPFRKLDDVV
ncbi:hypothetical protein BDZ97DRAFT_779686 [Flammula alnicola]|nr:hypothetical protein BDZ97DRAFT_779686 [Flammula alnicola]